MVTSMGSFLAYQTRRWQENRPREERASVPKQPPSWTDYSPHPRSAAALRASAAYRSAFDSSSTASQHVPLCGVARAAACLSAGRGRRRPFR